MEELASCPCTRCTVNVPDLAGLRASVTAKLCYPGVRAATTTLT